MAILSLRSVQQPTGAGVSSGPRLYAYDELAKKRYAYGNLAAVAVAGDIATIIGMCRIPQGRVRILPWASYIWCSAWGAARTIDIGLEAYYGSDGKTLVAAAPTQLKAAKDVSGALAASQIDTASHIDVFSQGALSDRAKGPLVTFTVGGDTVPVNATAEIMLAFLCT